MDEDCPITMSYFGRSVILNSEQLKFLATYFRVSQASSVGSGCLLLLGGAGNSSVVLEDDRQNVRLIWADPGTVEELKLLGPQFEPQ